MSSERRAYRISKVRESAGRVSTISKAVVGIAGNTLIRVMTLPYYRLYQFNTLHPMLRLARLTSQSQDARAILPFMRHWRARKISELQFISIACAVLAAAVIGSFSWATLNQAYWVASALWYSSLILSILGILVASQQVTVFEFLGAQPKNDNSPECVRYIRRYLSFILRENHPQPAGRSPEIGAWSVRWKMVFVWQCPVMFMAYSVCAYLAGLTIYVCTPFIRGDPWGAGSNVAVVYLTVTALAGGTFVFCSFWVYHYVDLEQEAPEIDETYTPAVSELNSLPFQSIREAI